jgi:murein DD-endopeptidase MepM/ murein hydrolase activator NlpD
MTDGIVISLEERWETTSNLKGGKYIYIYCPLKKHIYYYAHNDKLLVKIGQIIKAGTVIATVGRTGFSAFQKRSPTHLHIMGLQLDSTSCPYPINIYLELKKCKTI